MTAEIEATAMNCQAELARTLVSPGDENAAQKFGDSLCNVIYRQGGGQLTMVFSF